MARSGPSRALHLAAMRLALAEALPLGEARHRLLEQRQAERAKRRRAAEARARCGTEVQADDEPEQPRLPWWKMGDMA